MNRIDIKIDREPTAHTPFWVVFAQVHNMRPRNGCDKYSLTIKIRL